MRRVIAAALLVAAVATAVGWRLYRRDAVARAVSRALQPGTPLAAATAALRQQGVAFTTATAADGTTLVTYGRVEGRGGAVTEQRIVFDPAGRLREVYAFTRITGQ